MTRRKELLIPIILISISLYVIYIRPKNIFKIIKKYFIFIFDFSFYNKLKFCVHVYLNG